MDKIKLIIVEDEPAILQGITGLIKRIDLPLVITGTYYNGREALDDLNASRPDIVITDVQMPVMNGLELITNMKKMDYLAEYLILSGYAEFEYVKEALSLGVTNYLLKSPSISELKESLSAICDRILQNRYEKRRELFQDMIYRSYPVKQEKKDHASSSFRLFLYVLGPYIEAPTSTLHYSISDFQSHDVMHYIKKALGEAANNIWVLNGHFSNIKIIISENNNENMSPEQIYNSLIPQADCAKKSVTLIASETLESVYKISETVIRCMKYAKKFVRFGKNQLIKINSKTDISNIAIADTLSKADRTMLSKVLSASKPELVIKQYQYFVEKWKAGKYSQPECTALTTYILLEIHRQISDPHRSDMQLDISQKAAEIAAQSNSLDTFAEKICQFIKDIYINSAAYSEDNQIEAIVELLWNHIHANFSSEIDVTAFSKAHGYHHVYLITQFSRIKNISPTRLIIQLRMNLAKELLTTTEMSLKDIADTIGYDNVSYFSRIFKNHEGKSPSEYRRLSR